MWYHRYQKNLKQQMRMQNDFVGGGNQEVVRLRTTRSVCRAPPPQKYGRWVCTNENERFTGGDACELKCRDGYRPIGSKIYVSYEHIKNIKITKISVIWMSMSRSFVQVVPVHPQCTMQPNIESFRILRVRRVRIWRWIWGRFGRANWLQERV